MPKESTNWKPRVDIESFNQKVVELEQAFLAFLQKEKPLEELYNLQALRDIYNLIDLDPWQAYLFTRIKNSHAMTPRHGINVMILIRTWCQLFHKLGKKLDDFCFTALVHDAGHWFSGNLIYVFARYNFEQADQLGGHCLNLDWGKNVLTDEMKDWILNHHENYDGSGYPNQRKNPSLLPHMIRIADCFEGLTTKRHFRPPLSYAQAMDRMQKWTPFKFHSGLMKSWQQFLGKFPPGTGLIRKSGEVSVVIPGNPCFYQLILTNKFGDNQDGSIEPLLMEDIKSETVPYFQPPLPETWRALRPDTMQLKRNYLESNQDDDQNLQLELDKPRFPEDPSIITDS